MVNLDLNLIYSRYAIYIICTMFVTEFILLMELTPALELNFENKLIL